jgi:hypothetical protein
VFESCGARFFQKSWTNGSKSSAEAGTGKMLDLLRWFSIVPQNRSANHDVASRSSLPHRLALVDGLAPRHVASGSERRWKF